MANSTADGSVVIGVDMNIRQAEKRLEKLRGDIKETEKKIADMTKAKEEAREKSLFQAAQIDTERRKLDEIKDRLADIRALSKDKSISIGQREAYAAQIPSMKQELDDQKARVSALQSEWNKIENSVDSYSRKILDSSQKVESLKAEAEIFAQEIDEAAKQGNPLDEIAASAVVADQEIADLNRELQELLDRKTLLENAGVGLGFEEYDQAVVRIQEINSELKKYREGLQPVEAKEESAASLAERLSEAMKRAASSVTGVTKKAIPALTHLKKRVSDLGREKGFEKAGKSAERFGRRLKSIVTGAVFFNVISRGLTELTKQIGKYLAVNQGFENALSGLKSNLLTAFQPVYETILPALTRLMEALENVTAKFAVFMATIFGTTAEKAQKNAEELYDQANATEEAADAVEEMKEQQKEAEKEQKKYLASFDTIEKLGEKQKEEEKKEEKEEEDEKGKPDFETDFSQVQAPQWLLDFWKVFQDGWEQYGAPTMEAFRAAIQKIKDLITALRDAFMSVWTGGAGLEFLGNIAKLLQTIFGIVGDIAAAFKDAWDRKGEEVVSALFYMFNSILSLIISIGESFREAWNDGRGVEICETLLEIFRNIFLFIGNIADRIKEAWEANGNGVAIWGAILDIIRIVLNTIRDITDATVKWSQDLDLEPLVSGFRNMAESLVPVVKTIGETLTGIWKDTVLPFLSWLLEDALPELLNKVASLFDFLAKNPAIIQELTKWVLSFIAAWQIGGIIGELASMIAKLDPIKIGLLAVIASFIKLAEESEPFREALGGALESLGKLLKSIIELFGELWPILEPIAEVIGVVLVRAVQLLAEALNFLIGVLTSAIKALKEFVSFSANDAAKNLNKYKTGAKAQNSGGMNILRTASVPTAYSAAALMDSYPHLASGAVIAPNHEFLAVLGDQRNGTNIETPLQTMKQAFLEAIGESGLLEQKSGGGGGDMYMDGQRFARLIYPYLQGERSRLGVNLVGGGY